ncbi:hypothetical protein [Deinococcus sp.]|uniref:hypothetical protein n=1 Tax=Deinococcus sp. TaxID=47478 RepID=UPI00286986F7|nr:hypothetical protein [Deinococcus sp.]
MPDITEFTPLVVPVIIGVVLLRLVVELLLSLVKPAGQRAAAVRGAWGHFTSVMFLAAFLLPFLTPVLGRPVNTAPLWTLLVVGGIVGALHAALLMPRRRGAGGVQAERPAAPVSTTVMKQRKPAPAGPATVRVPPAVRESREPDSAERAIVGLPLPRSEAAQNTPLTGDQADGWYRRQDDRLQRSLSGKELATAQLRLSTVKSMLILGQIGPGDADRDVGLVLRRAGRG